MDTPSQWAANQLNNICIFDQTIDHEQNSNSERENGKNFRGHTICMEHPKKGRQIQILRNIEQTIRAGEI